VSFFLNLIYVGLTLLLMNTMVYAMFEPYLEWITEGGKQNHRSRQLDNATDIPNYGQEQLT
jgi:hypothetical protein